MVIECWRGEEILDNRVTQIGIGRIFGFDDKVDLELSARTKKDTSPCDFSACIRKMSGIYWMIVLTAMIDNTERRQQMNDIQNLLESTSILNTGVHAAVSGLLR